jgi:hypothetical protein
MSLVFGLLLFAGCEPDETREYWGNLYFAAGSYLGQLDLRDGSVSVLTSVGDASIREIDAFGEDQLLLTVLGPVNHKDTFRLMQFQLDTNGLVTLINGRHGRYLPVPEALIFDDGAHLRVRVYGGGPMQELTVIQHRFGSSVHIMQVSATQFLYSVGRESTIHTFDVDSRESLALAELSRECQLDGALWIDARDALLCKLEDASTSYRFLGLDGSARGALAIPDAGPYRAVAYLADQDALVLTQTWNTVVSDSVRYAIWIYDLASGRMVRLVEDQYLGSSVVYRPH